MKQLTLGVLTLFTPLLVHAASPMYLVSECTAAPGKVIINTETRDGLTYITYEDGSECFIPKQ